MEELTFRIEAILRRVRGKKNRERTIYQLASYTFDTKKQVLSRNGESKKLTTKESELLGLLCAHTNEILQRDFALKKIWIDDNYFNARSIDVYIPFSFAPNSDLEAVPKCKSWHGLEFLQKGARPLRKA